ncbi:MAG: DUF1573 domain-containing protein [Planctomycetes bacterium]|nr:DUF1573 domain-containing protein [Planctomycetota bacterium]
MTVVRFGVILASLLAAPLYAVDVRFTATERSFAMPAASDQLVARFPFTNHGAAAVRFQVAKPTCPCETIQLDDDRIGPGEDGMIAVTLAIEPGERAERRSIRVQFADDGASVAAPAQQIELVIRVVPPSQGADAIPPAASAVVMSSPAAPPAAAVRSP